VKQGGTTVLNEMRQQAVVPPLLSLPVGRPTVSTLEELCLDTVHGRVYTIFLP